MKRWIAALTVLAAAAAPAFAQPPPPSSSPAASVAAAPAREASVPVITPHAMVTAANPLAASAGLAVLKRGGSAMDAAVAVQAVLGLVEPQSSGLGGGAFMVYYDAKTRKVTAYDGREVAPKGAGPDMFLGPDGKPLPFFQAILSGRSAGVPGAVAMLYLAHKEHGRLAWSGLFDQAEKLADDGFVVSPRLDFMIHLKQAPQPSAPDAVRYFSKPDGTELKAGDVLKNPAYAETLRLVAKEGPNAILTGRIAQDIVKRLSEGPLPGSMTLADLAAYRPHESEALCRPYRVYLVCTTQAPSGGPALLEALGLIEHTDIASRGPADAQGWLQIAEAERLMYADRDKYEGDPAFVSYPLEGLLDRRYLAQRAKLIGDTAGPAPTPGHPAGVSVAYGPDHTREPGGTSHFVIVDADGNVVSMTTTVESIFGDGRMVDGFFLNNQLTDFSFAPKDPDGAPAANAVGPGKRPRSSMAPNIILDAHRDFFAAVGSPGGNAIPAFVLKAIVGFIDWKLPMQQALDLPNLVARGPAFYGEADRFPPAVVKELAAKGVVFQAARGAEGSGLHGIMKVKGGYEGGADDRREGVAVGY
ncbi:MAG TPA: gamma-glutamyltransferase [Caulobacteraceae bacterium]|nr:gamma-glutamyltransferase [Caulobacteraceae bacterium]